MPHATNLEDVANDEDDDILIGRVLNAGDPSELENGLDLQRDLDPGEKADDAVDFGDLADDDLADDEDLGDDLVSDHQGQSKHNGNTISSLNALSKDAGLVAVSNENHFDDDAIDDLFGDNPSSPVEADERRGDVEGYVTSHVTFGNEREQLHSKPGTRPASSPLTSRNQPPIRDIVPDFQDSSLSREQQLQMELFQMSRPGQESLPAPPENQEELLASLWPKFHRNTIPRFIDLLPPKKARYAGKGIPKPPKPVNPTKISLELARDQEKSFKIWPAFSRKSDEDSENVGQIFIKADTVPVNIPKDDLEMDSDFEDDTIGGVSWQDLQLACEDWDSPSIAGSLESEQMEEYNNSHTDKSAEMVVEQDKDHWMELAPAKVNK